MDQSLDVEFHSDVPGLGVEELRAETEEWLGDLARDHTDIIGASVALELVADAATPPTRFKHAWSPTCGRAISPPPKRRTRQKAP